MTRIDDSDVLDVLRTGPVGVASTHETRRQRDELLPWLEGQVAAVPRRRRAFLEQKSRRFRGLAAGAGLLAAATASLIIWSASSSEKPGDRSTPTAAGDLNNGGRHHFATLVEGQVRSGSVELLSGSRVGHESRITTESDQGARLRDSSGFEVTLDPRSDFAFRAQRHLDTEQDKYVELSRGRASFSVPPMPAGSTLSVVTETAQITVIGTKFSVSIRDDAQTCVRVDEGRVSVVSQGRQIFLSPGEETGCTDRTASSKPIDEVPESLNEPHEPDVIRRVGSRPKTVGTLAEQNALLTRALSEERQGHHQEAVLALEQLLRAHPDSPFLPEARAGLARLRKKMN